MLRVVALVVVVVKQRVKQRPHEDRFRCCGLKVRSSTMVHGL